MVAGDQRDGIPRAIYGKHDAATAPWGDPRVRVAMHRAVDWPAILDFQTNKDKFSAAASRSTRFHDPRAA